MYPTNPSKFLPRSSDPLIIAHWTCTYTSTLAVWCLPPHTPGWPPRWPSLQRVVHPQGSPSPGFGQRFGEPSRRYIGRASDQHHVRRCTAYELLLLHISYITRKKTQCKKWEPSENLCGNLFLCFFTFTCSSLTTFLLGSKLKSSSSLSLENTAYVTAYVRQAADKVQVYSPRKRMPLSLS